MDKKQIKLINIHGITYLDDQGQEQFIDFRECYEHYLKEHLNSKAWKFHIEAAPRKPDWDAYLSYIVEKRVVGTGAIRGLYLVLYTEPEIDFEFETMEEIQKIILAIHNTGWVTENIKI